MATDCRTSTLVTICLDQAEAVQQALPLILSFAAVGSPPSVVFEASQSSPLAAIQSLDAHLKQLTEFGVTEIFATQRAKWLLDQHCRLSSKVISDSVRVRALHTQVHAIYAF